MLWYNVISRYSSYYFKMYISEITNKKKNLLYKKINKIKFKKQYLSAIKKEREKQILYINAYMWKLDKRYR